MPISQLKQSPIRHNGLPLLLVARVSFLHQALEEVYSQPIEKWLDGFQRDTNPESEVEWWERLTRLYTDYVESRDLTLEQRKVVFKAMFTLAMGNGIGDMKAILSSLPGHAEHEIVALFGGRPQ